MSDLAYDGCGAVIALVIGGLMALFVRRELQVLEGLKDCERFWGEEG